MTVDITYSQNFISISRQELIEAVQAAMSKDRFNHVLRVEETAIALADQYNVNQEKVSIAALLHDYAKERETSDLKDTIINENLDLELLDYGNSILHGPVGSVLAQQEFDIEDDEIINAIYYHTFGRKNMTKVEQVIFVADYIEPGRDMKPAKKARDLAEDSLDQALGYIVKETLLHLIEKKKLIFPRALETYNSVI